MHAALGSCSWNGGTLRFGWGGPTRPNPHALECESSLGYERGCRDARRSSRWRRSPGFEGKRRGFRTEGAGRISGPEGKALYPRGRRGRARNSPEKGESGGTSRFRTSKPAGRRRRVRVRRSRRTLSRDPLRGDGRGTRSGDVRSRPFPRRGRRRDRRGASRPPRRRGGLRGGARRSGAKDRSKNGEGRRRSRGGAEGGGTRGGPSLRSFPASSSARSAASFGSGFFPRPFERRAPNGDTWLILPAIICLSKRLSHARLSISDYTAKLQTAHYISYTLLGRKSYLDNCRNSRANTC